MFLLICAVCFVLVIYLNIRELKKSTKHKSLPLWVVPCIITTFLLLPVIILTLIAFVLFRHIISVILRNKHGSSFGGFLEGSDCMHMTEDDPPTVINSLLMFRCIKEMSVDDFYENIKNGVRKCQQYKKLNSKFYKFCNYCYMLKDQLQVSDCIREMKMVDCQKDKIGKEEFLSLFSECCNWDLPQDNKVFWEVIVGKQKVNWKNDEYDYYPVVFRCGHGVADGVTLIELLIKVFSDTTYFKMNYKSEQIDDLVWIEKIKDILVLGVRLLLLLPATSISLCLLKANDHNILSGLKLRRLAHYAVNIEDSSIYVETIKRIKNAIPEFSFSNMVLAAFAASLNDYFLKRSVKIEWITTCIPYLSGSSRLQHVTSDELVITDSYIKNKMGVFIANTPIFVGFENDKASSVLKRLDLVRKQSHILKHSLEYQMFDVTLNFICPYLPLTVCKSIKTLLKLTAAFSILSGPSKIRCWEDSVEISDIVGFTPLTISFGVSALINTYDGRLSIGICVDKDLIQHEGDVQEIANNVLKHIDEFDKHTDTLRCFSWSE